MEAMAVFFVPSGSKGRQKEVRLFSHTPVNVMISKPGTEMGIRNTKRCVLVGRERAMRSNATQHGDDDAAEFENSEKRQKEVRISKSRNPRYSRERERVTPVACN